MFGGPRFNGTKLKVNLKLAINRSTMLQKKKENQGNTNKKEVAKLLEREKPELARIKTEQIIRDDYMIETLEIMEVYFNLLVSRFGLIEANKICDQGIREAVSTILWATPYLQSEIPEMKACANFLGTRYGKEFVQDAMENRSETVSPRVIKKLQVTTPSSPIVEGYIQAIALSYNIPYVEPLEPLPDHLADGGFGAEMFPDAPTGMPPTNGNGFGGGGGYGGGGGMPAGGGFGNPGYGGPGVPQANVDALFPPAPGIYPPQQPQQDVYPPMQPQQPIYPPMQPQQPVYQEVYPPEQPQVYQPPPMEKQPSAPPPVEYAPEKPGFPSAVPPSRAGSVAPQLQPPANPAAYLEVAPSPPRPDPAVVVAVAPEADFPIGFAEPPRYNEAEPKALPSGDIPSPLSSGGLADADIGSQEADPMAGFPMPPGMVEPAAQAAPTAPPGGIPDVPAEDPEANPTVGEESAVPDFDELLNRFHALKSDDAPNGE